jgi:hypothetical protein
LDKDGYNGWDFGSMFRKNINQERQNEEKFVTQNTDGWINFKPSLFWDLTQYRFYVRLRDVVRQKSAGLNYILTES